MRAFLIGLLSSFMVLVGVALAVTFVPTRVVQAYGVVSECGVYAIVVDTNKGTVLVDADNQNDPALAELREQVLALPEDKMHGIAVPCAGIAI